MNLENINQEDILEEIKIEEESFVIFKNPKDNDYISISIANMAEKNNKFSWFRKDKPYTGIETELISWQLDTYSKKDFTISAGTDFKTISNFHKKNKNASIIYENKGIYFFIKSGNLND